MKTDDLDGADEIREQLPRLAAATGAPAPGDGRSLPSIPINQPIGPLALAVAQCLRRAPLFRRAESLVTVNGTTGEDLPMDADRWATWHQNFVTFHTGDDAKRRIVDMEHGRVRRILASDALRAHVRELRAVNRLRLPAWRGEGAGRTLDLLPEGFDAATRTFTVPVLDYPTDWRLEDAHAWLAATFGTFALFETGELFARRSFAAHVAGMLGVFVVNLLREGAVRPMIVVNGNQVGLGKTLLTHAQLSPVHGEIEDDSKPTSDEEMRNVLDAAALAAAPYLVLDDSANLRSHDLNRFVTSSIHVPRVKGYSRRVRCPNVTQVFATGNALNLTEDLDRRALVVDLFDPGTAAARSVRNPLTNPFLFSDAYRAPACAALWAMLNNWCDLGMPICAEARKPSFEDYAALVGSVLVAAGIANPFTPRECVAGGDEAGRALQSAVCRLASTADQGEAFSPDEILTALRESETLDDVLPFDCRDERKALGHKLRKLRGREFTDTRGRRFEFGKRDAASGSRYVVHFLAEAAPE